MHIGSSCTDTADYESILMCLIYCREIQMIRRHKIHGQLGLINDIMTTGIFPLTLTKLGLMKAHNTNLYAYSL